MDEMKLNAFQRFTRAEGTRSVLASLISILVGILVGFIVLFKENKNLKIDVSKNYIIS